MDRKGDRDGSQNEFFVKVLENSVGTASDWIRADYEGEILRFEHFPVVKECVGLFVFKSNHWQLLDSVRKLEFVYNSNIL